MNTRVPGYQPSDSPEQLSNPPETGSAVQKPAKAQRIKMRMHEHPVKHDGTLVWFSPDGESFVVAFDGPLPNRTFYRWGASRVLVLDTPPKRGSNGEYSHPAGNYQFWEVL